MELDPYYEKALSSQNPLESFRAMAIERLTQGHDRAAITTSFQEARRQLRLADREADEDAMMDALDCLVGWCSPHMLVPPESAPPTRQPVEVGLARRAPFSDNARG